MAEADRGPKREQGTSSTAPAGRAPGILKPGISEPGFTLNSTPDQTVALSDFGGQPVILAFYPADWSPVCGDQPPAFPPPGRLRAKGAVARSYGAYRAREGVAERTLFVLDDEGTIVWSYRSPIGVNPGADGILEALESLPTTSRRA
jgi:peroxiredoxin